MAVPVVVIHQHGDGLEDIRVAIAAIAFPVFAAPQIVPVPLDVAVYNQVEPAVIVQIYPGGGSGPSAPAHASLLGHVGKTAIPVVVIETIAAISGDVEVFVTVVVIIGHRHAHAVAHAL